MLFAPVPDQRRSERRWIAITVQIRTGETLMEGTTLNLSDHGMYLFTAANIPLGSEIEITFRPPEEEPVRMSAIVRRKVVYLYGIEFLERRIEATKDQDFLRSSDGTPFSPPAR